MAQLIEDDTIRLSSGREIYANNGILGMSAGMAAEGIKYTDGYDGSTYTRKSHDKDEYTDEWTPAERQELAEYVIGLWRAWADRQTAPGPPLNDPALTAWAERANSRLEALRRG